MACFSSFLHYIAHSSTRGFWTLKRAHGFIKSREWLKLIEIVNYGKRNLNHAKNLKFDLFRALCARTTRARTCTDAKFWNAQKWPETCSPLIRFGFWAFLNFDARARARRDAHGDVDCQIVGKWPEVYCVVNMVDLGWMVMKIWMITWIHKMAPGWRHGLSDDTEKLIGSIRNQNKDTVKIWKS